MSQHWLMAVILLPLATAGLLLLPGERHRAAKGWLNLASCLAGLALAAALLHHAAGGTPEVYLAGNWAAPFGIVLVLDRLSALMITLVAVLACATLLFAMARWTRAGANFHALFQVQLMGLYGAFLTGDLFNLFVFFEVMLAASYGLVLHGSGRARVVSGLHYLAINLVASSLFLIGAALIYGVTGTLNMADIALKVPQVAVADLGLLHTGAAILAIAFLAKAGMWPLNAWLVPAYSAASPPVAALFAVLTKVGFYTLLRLWLLVFPASAGASAQFGEQWLLYGGLATLACATLGLLATRRLERIASLNILVSAGTLLASVGLGTPALVSAALFYLVSSTLALAALFLLAELIERSRSANELPLEEDADILPGSVGALRPPPGVNLDDEQRVIVGRVIPWTMAFLGMSLIFCALWVIGMPPFSGFLAKLNLIAAVLDPAGVGQGGHSPSPPGWVFIALLLLAGVASLIGLARVAILRLWAPVERPSPALRPYECLAISALFGICIALTLRGEVLLRYTTAAASDLYNPPRYIGPVMAKQPSAGPRALLQEAP
ncbi:monovalent cation/H+ antiporter subunit D [Pseudomonas typographi]|uniref:Monovalent cation/H+ antiporter subunit D n=1 Tax=Pseudomonas typographi TaxID=2715964 RepID=A0ABR7Z796_9PSED|nr:monovalent cation/H+ antiporter subunit D [Pseudomonas typographi]MBD1554032.1 monovalent cation/H+ antiporter subunit D [Pseudomonas typographi]MBD1589223.1 monovalent cation/H+ antiporter subunit D [Pseudomonas typographi]MBD1601252.1 monovalent cation/H+ antiporter subunit D [Pseudomonas typographi]